MSISKAPVDKNMKPIEQKMPDLPEDQRSKICDDAGHRFSPAIMYMIDTTPAALPDKALCIRCGKSIKLSTII